MNFWFRVYNTMVDDPKVQQLPDALFKALVNLWCLASQNDGKLPDAGDVAFKLRLPPAKAAEIVTKLVMAGLIDNEDGVFRPHNWGARQFKSDGSTARVQRFRERQKHGATETGPEKSIGESDQSTAKPPRAGSNGLEGRADIVDLALRARLTDAFGASRCPDLARSAVWISKGYEPGMVVEVVRELLARKPDISSLAYFDSALAERHARRPASPSERAGYAAVTDFDKVIAMWVRQGVWSKYAGPEPGMGGCRAPVELLAKHGLAPDGSKIREEKADV